MFQKPVEGLSFLSADDALARNETFEVFQVLPVLQLGSFQFRTFPANMARMAGPREFLIRVHPAAAPAIMSMSFTLLCHSYFSFVWNKD